MNVGLELKKLNILIGRKVLKETKKRGYSISDVQIKILNYLYDCNDKKIYQRDIEKEFQIRRSTVSGILHTMEKNQFIIRVDSDSDARMKQIIINDNVKDKLKEIRKEISLFEKNLINNIDEEDLKTFLKVIHQMQKNIERMS